MLNFWGVYTSSLFGNKTNQWIYASVLSPPGQSYLTTLRWTNIAMEILLFQLEINLKWCFHYYLRSPYGNLQLARLENINMHGYPIQKAFWGNITWLHYILLIVHCHMRFGSGCMIQKTTSSMGTLWLFEIAGTPCLVVVFSQIVQLRQTDSWHFVHPSSPWPSHWALSAMHQDDQLAVFGPAETKIKCLLAEMWGRLVNVVRIGNTSANDGTWQFHDM